MHDYSSLDIGNSAGFCKGPGPVFNDLLSCPITNVITVGSFTLTKRDGNPGTTYWCSERDGTSVNALGLPNSGSHALAATLAQLFERANEKDKLLNVSIAGDSPEEYGRLARIVHAYAHRIEVNLGCPNVWGEEGQKSIASFSPELVATIIRAVWSQIQGQDAEMSVKLSPYSDPALLREVGLVIRKLGVVSRIVTCNTFPNGIAFEKGQRVIDPKFGGVGGTALRHIALGQVSQFVSLFQELGVTMPVIGVGGISSGKDFNAMLNAGAAGIQIGTAFGERRVGEQAKIFSQIMQESV